jgi:hypothetical protein
LIYSQQTIKPSTPGLANLDRLKPSTKRTTMTDFFLAVIPSLSFLAVLLWIKKEEQKDL